MTIRTHQIAFVQLSLDQFSCVVVRKHAPKVVDFTRSGAVIEIHAAHWKTPATIGAWPRLNLDHPSLKLSSFRTGVSPTPFFFATPRPVCPDVFIELGAISLRPSSMTTKRAAKFLSPGFWSGSKVRIAARTNHLTPFPLLNRFMHGLSGLVFSNRVMDDLRPQASVL